VVGGGVANGVVGGGVGSGSILVKLPPHLAQEVKLAAASSCWRSMPSTFSACFI
jgi:hypothetical protein